MYRTAIIEDDPFAREMLNDLLASHSGDYVVAGFFDSVKSAVKSLPALKPDLVFLDMELPDGKGFDILEQLLEISFEIIVTTMHDSYTLQAIRHSALDYLLKPIQSEGLALALKQFENKPTRHRMAASAGQFIPNNKIILSMNEELLFLDIAEIIRLESDGSYTHFHMQDKKKHTTSRTMATYEPKLQAHGFFRVHHGHLINVNHVGKYVKGEGGYVIMTDKSTVEVSRRKKEEFLKALGY